MACGIMGTYTALSFFGSDGSFIELVGGVLAFVAGYKHYQEGKEYEADREEELESILRTGAVEVSMPTPLRPLLLGAGIYFLIDGAAKVLGGSFGLVGIVEAMSGLAMASGCASGYFSETTMIPPGKQKVTLRSLYTAVKGKRVPKGLLEPVPDYGS